MPNIQRAADPLRYLGTGRASKLLGVTPIKLQGMALRGEIPYLRSEPDGRTLFDRFELERYKAGHTALAGV